MVYRLHSLSISNVTVPKMQFKHPLLTGEESNRCLTAVVQRSGDITHRSTVRCYTRQGSAQVASDFEERPNTDASIITFLPGKVCRQCSMCEEMDFDHLVRCLFLISCCYTWPIITTGSNTLLWWLCCVTLVWKVWIHDEKIICFKFNHYLIKHTKYNTLFS